MHEETDEKEKLALLEGDCKGALANICIIAQELNDGVLSKELLKAAACLTEGVFKEKATEAGLEVVQLVLNARLMAEKEGCHGQA